MKLRNQNIFSIFQKFVGVALILKNYRWGGGWGRLGPPPPIIPQNCVSTWREMEKQKI